MAAHAGAAVAAMVAAPGAPGRSLLLEATIAALMVAQGCLLGAWVAFGGRPAPWRLAGTSVALVLGIIALKSITYERDVFQVGFLVLAQMLGTSVPLLAARFVGLEVARSLPDGSVPTVYRFQFSLRGMLEWTAAVAILLGILPLASEEFREMFRPRDLCRPVGLFAIDGLVATAALWVTLGVQRTAVRLAVLAASGVGMAIFLASMQPPDTLLVVVFPLLVAALLLASLWVFRGLGYRLVWRRSLRL